ERFSFPRQNKKFYTSEMKYCTLLFGVLASAAVANAAVSKPKPIDDFSDCEEHVSSAHPVSSGKPVPPVSSGKPPVSSGKPVPPVSSGKPVPPVSSVKPPVSSGKPQPPKSSAKPQPPKSTKPHR